MGEKTGSVGNKRKNRNQPDPSIDKIGNEICSHSDSSEKPTVNADGKNSRGIIIIIIIIIIRRRRTKKNEMTMGDLKM